MEGVSQLHAPHAAILFDKFHVMKHLGEALDKARKAEYARRGGGRCQFIKGHKYTLLSHPQNVTGTARKNLKLLLAANKRLNTAYLLKESFAQLWDYNREAWARKFFENRRASLNWQCLKPYEKFAEMIERDWDGLAAYCQPKNKVSLGFVGVNNRIQVMQRRTYGLRDEEYLRLKVLPRCCLEFERNMTTFHPLASTTTLHSITQMQEKISSTCSVNNTQSTLKSLQILRAIAATSVVYYHIGFDCYRYEGAGAIPIFGAFGVDVFFVISGFVMAMIVANGESPRIFALSRITRIVPLYWVATVLLFFLVSIKPELLNATVANPIHFIKSLFFIPYSKSNGQIFPMLSVGWTLNYEMFFYLCIWLSIVVARKHFLVVTSFFITTTYIVASEYSKNYVLNSVFGNSLLFEFAFGMLAYQAHQSGVLEKIGNVPLAIISLASYGFMVYAAAYNVKADRALIFGLPSIALVLSVTSLEKSAFIRNTRIASLVATMGDASYATYLTHFYVVEGMKRVVFRKLDLFNPFTPFGVFIVIFLSLVVGQVVYTSCDKPLSKYLKRKFIPATPRTNPPAGVSV